MKKHSFAVRARALLFTAGIIPNMSQAQTAIVGSQPGPTPVGYQIGEQGANYRNWNKIVQTTNAQGNIILQTNLAYVELASGLNYKDATTAQWLPSKEEIDGYAGGAIAQYGQHKVVFANNLNSAGAIDLQTPDGQEMRSHVLGLSYYDSSSDQSVLIAQIRDCQGQIIGSNQVVYADAFDGVSADMCYTYHRGSFEQDVILQAQPPTPESFGLNSASTVLQVLTEFDSAPAPSVKAIAGQSQSGDEDELLDFGAMKMIRGRAFAIGQNPLDGVRVSKQWQAINGRTILIESVPVSAIQSQLNQLAKTGQANQTLLVGRASPRAVAKNSILNIVSAKRLLPAPKLAKANGGSMKLAMGRAGVLASRSSKAFVLDYVTVDGSMEDYTFQSGVTYYVSDEFTINGTLTVQGGAVIKYAPGFMYGEAVDLCGALDWQADAYHPVIFTEKDDNSAGDIISGSTGSPVISTGEALMFDIDTGPNDIWDAYFYYSKCGVDYGAGPPGFVRDCRFINDTVGIFDAPSSNPVLVENCLFDHIGNAVFLGVNYGDSIQGVNLTIHHAANLVTNVMLSVTNSLFICVTNWGHTFTGADNATNSSDAGVFASGPFGNEYLADNTYRNVGTTNIDPDLLADLRQTTTYTPADGSYPDTDTPDLGYHYPIIGSIGTDFWLAFFNMYDGDTENLSLYISSQSGATGTVTIPGFGINNTFTVAAGSVTNMVIDSSMMILSNGIETNGIHITASQSVSVYALEYVQGGTAVFTGYPTPLLGTNYCIMARPSYLNYEIIGHSELGIVATAGYTTVTITPSTNADLVGFFTSSTNIVLQRGQTYQIQSSDELSDVTGTRITSDKPIAVFAGANEAYVGSGAVNPLMQEQLPVDSWGTNALALSFADPTVGDLYRVLAYTNTTVTITNSFGVSIVTNLTAGAFCEVNLDGWVQFQANQPVQVAQFAENAGTSEGDPCEILLQPIGHYLASYTVVTGPPYLLPGSPGYNGDGIDPEGFNENYLNLIVAQSGTNSTYVDGVVITNFAAIGSSGYYGAQCSVTNGTHTVTSSQPVGFEIYGFGYYDAYGYFGGIVK